MIGLVRGLWFLLYCRHWALTGAPLGYPVTLSHGDPATLGQQGQTLVMLQQILDGVDDGMGQLLTLVLGGCWVGQLASSPSSSTPALDLRHCPG